MFNSAPRSIIDHGQCVGKDPSTFDDADAFSHPELTERQLFSLNSERRLRARVICSGCPVQLECLRWALETDLNTGTAGGLSSAQRDSVRRGSPVPGLLGTRQGAEPARAGHSQGDAMVKAFVNGATILEVSQRFGTSARTVTEEARRAVV